MNRTTANWIAFKLKCYVIWLWFLFLIARSWAYTFVCLNMSFSLKGLCKFQQDIDNTLNLLHFYTKKNVNITDFIMVTIRLLYCELVLLKKCWKNCLFKQFNSHRSGYDNFSCHKNTICCHCFITIKSTYFKQSFTIVLVNSESHIG